MRLAVRLAPSNPEDAARRRRALTLAVTVALHVLVLILLFRFVPHASAPEQAGGPLSVIQLPDAHVAPTPTPKTAAKSKPKAAASGSVAQAPTPKPPPPPPPTPNPSATGSLNIVRVTSEDFQGGDISKLPTHAHELASSDAASGQQSADAKGVGQGPGGVQLFNPDWQREPTSAELDPYLPHRGTPAEGWGLIACKTAEGFKVEDCKTIGESPEGSGLARAVLSAAWQFRVLPPRVNGKPQIGAWVKIEIDYTSSGMAVGRRRG